MEGLDTTNPVDYDGVSYQFEFEFDARKQYQLWLGQDSLLGRQSAAEPNPYVLKALLIPNPAGNRMQVIGAVFKEVSARFGVIPGYIKGGPEGGTYFYNPAAQDSVVSAYPFEVSVRNNVNEQASSPAESPS
jgi:hypothetical protein